jgi:hypothetical protein
MPRRRRELALWRGCFFAIVNHKNGERHPVLQPDGVFACSGVAVFCLPGKTVVLNHIMPFYARKHH